ncbi:MAG: peptidoglycan-associated lipoprotein Pal [Methylococcales bacterium]
MKTILYKVIPFIFAGLLIGCETTGDEGLSDDETTLDSGRDGGQGTDADGALSQGLDSGSVDSANSLDGPQGLASESKRVIYFVYDSAEIRPEYIPIVEKHARYVVSHPEIQVTLEGHADERGSREYNIALGEQRANSVFRKMGVQGVGSSQVSLVSFGEEKPASFGHDESAWQLNRRVEIRYPGY